MSFKDIKGQDKAIKLLKDYIKDSHIASAYLFIGPEGTGKKMVAEILAKVVNCSQEDSDSCDSCISCLKIDKHGHPDFHLLGSLSENDTAASDAIKIEEVRQLQKDINLKPYEGKKSVFIIDNAHHLTAEASNALLKVLEEPPRNSLIILISSKPALLFKTIISRCQILKFSPLPRPELERILKEDYSLDSHQAHFLAFFSEGRLGYALRLKDTDIFREKNMIIDEYSSSARSRLEYALVKNRDNLRRYLNILAAWLRDIYLIKVGITHAQIINRDRKDLLLKLINRYTFNDLDEALNYISDALLYLEQNINSKLLLSNLRYFMKV